MIRILYGNGGHSMRDVSPVAIDARDLDAAGRPHPALPAVGERIGEVKDESGRVLVRLFDHVTPTRMETGEREFDHVLSAAELEREFPGHGKRLVEMQRVAAVRAAAASAAHDDEVASLVSAGVLRAADLSDLAEINARRKLRGKPPVA